MMIHFDDCYFFYKALCCDGCLNAVMNQLYVRAVRLVWWAGVQQSIQTYRTFQVAITT